MDRQDQQTSKALIVQGDGTLLLDVHAPGADEARRDIGPFAELEKSPEHLHTYRMTPLSLWNASAAGLNPGDVLSALRRHSRYPIPAHVESGTSETMGRYGLLRLVPGDRPEFLLLVVARAQIHAELSAHKKLAPMLAPADLSGIPEAKEGFRWGFLIDLMYRGTIKQELIRLGWPVQDEVPLKPGEPYSFNLKNTLPNGKSFSMRDYQVESVEAILGDGRPGLGYGTIVLPCGAGKTVVGIGAMARLGMSTLILTTNVAAVHQWIRELKEKTDIPDEDIGEYTGDLKTIGPITVATYQILVWRPEKEGPFPHFGLLSVRDWGLVIYDEVHLLPAPVFRLTAELQAKHRLGLTATLVREDGMEADVFSLVGPKRYDTPWKDMEARGWIAEAWCHEIRVDLPVGLEIPYAVASQREKFRIAAENPSKNEVVRALIARHKGEGILVIGQYIEQLEILAKELDSPLITGKTPNKDRDNLYQAFRDGSIRTIVVSKVANFAIDLPDAAVAIQVSGSFGSRQEEAQRLGRILRPKERRSSFYSIVSRFTTEEEFSANRQKFLTEQGYRYQIEVWSQTADEVLL